MAIRQSKEFIIDADVLIDYWESDINLLRQFSEKIAQIYIGRSTFDKVFQIDESKAKAIKLELFTPDMELVDRAMQNIGKLSYDDHETLLIALQNDWTCITNDNALRSECKKEGVGLLWGLEPMKLLVKNNSLSVVKAIKTAKAVQLSNPDYITDAILSRFKEQIREIKK